MKQHKTRIEDFEAAKVLQKAKVPTAKAAVALGRSRDTIRRIYISSDWEDFRERLARHAAKIQEKKTPRVTEEDSRTPAEPTISISSNLQAAYNENLGIIAKKMDKNTEALEKLTISIYSLRKSLGSPNGEKIGRWTFGSPFKKEA